MKKILAVVSVCSVILFACVKTASDTSTVACTDATLASEQPEIQAFLATDSLTFLKDTSGVYYHIDTVGTGNPANAGSAVSFTYTAYLLNGTVVGYSTVPLEYALANTIPGFLSMAGYFRNGTHILLVIPSSLAYGCTGLSSGSATVVPPNAILYYDLTITAVQ